MSLLLKWEIWTETQTEGIQCGYMGENAMEDRGRDWGDASVS